MGSGGVGEVATIFHPRRSRTSNVALSEDQQIHSLFASPVQVALHTSGKLVLSYHGQCWNVHASQYSSDHRHERINLSKAMISSV